jgi:hypothetical protein
MFYRSRNVGIDRGGWCGTKVLPKLLGDDTFRDLVVVQWSSRRAKNFVYCLSLSQFGGHDWGSLFCRTYPLPRFSLHLF